MGDTPASFRTTGTPLGWEVELTFIDPSAELIDLLQYALVYGITVDWVPGMIPFIPQNVSVSRQYDSTYGSGKAEVHRSVEVSGYAKP